ncbi:MAG: FtsX-like permease family protein [Armatimonadetes bacterium]|nr:FtsX-like permease family protein [Armatimonadota bacterium]
MAISKYRTSNILILAIIVLTFLVLCFWNYLPGQGKQEVVRAAKTVVKPAEPTPDCAAAVKDRYREIAASIDSGRIADDVTTLSAYPSRVVGYPGCEQAADHVEKQFRSIGLSNVKAEKFKVTVPIDQGSKIVINGREIPIYALWPNLVRTSHLPPEGLSVHIIDGKSGRLPDFDSKVVAGSAALVDFNSGTEWLNAPRLGAKVLLFVEPDSTMRGEAEAKFSAIPVSMPRFWISKDHAARIRAMLSEFDAKYKDIDASKRPQLEARVFCKMPWEKVEARNIIGEIEGSDPKLKKQWIVLHASYDGTSVVPSLAPSAEATCGVSGLLELARLYKDPRFAPKRSVMFIATSGHYQGLAGMRSYMEGHIDSYVAPSGLSIWLAKTFPASGKTWTAPAVSILVLLILLWFVGRTWRRVQLAREEKPWIVGLPVLLLVLSLCGTGGIYARLAKGYAPVNQPRDYYLWSGLDLSSQTQGVGLFYKGYFYDYREDIQGKFSDIAGRSRENSERIAAALGFFDDKASRFADGVNPISGKNWRNFIPGKFALDSEVVTLAGGKGVSFVSIDDGRQMTDTPFDTRDKVNIENLNKQVTLLGCLIDQWFHDSNLTLDEEIMTASVIDSKSIRVSDPLTLGYVRGVFVSKNAKGKTYYKPRDEKQLAAKADGSIRLTESLPTGTKTVYVLHKPITKFGSQDPSRFTRMGLQGGFARLSGNVVQYDPRKSFVPNLRVGDCLAVVRSPHKSFMGVRANIIDKTTPVFDSRNPSRDQGYFEISGVAPLTAYGFQKPTSIGAYKLDPVNGDIICAPDQGSYGEFYPTSFPITTGFKDMPIIVFHCKATSIYDLIDPQSLRALGGMSIYEGDTNAAPKQFGVAVAVPEPQNPHVEDMADIFTEDTVKSGQKAAQSTDTKRIRLKMIMSAGPAANRLLLLNSTLDNEVIPTTITDSYVRALPTTPAWQFEISGIHKAVKKGTAYGEDRSKNFYLRDLTGADSALQLAGIVSIDRNIYEPTRSTPDPHPVPVSLDYVFVNIRQGTEGAEPFLIMPAKPFKILTIDKPWYVTAKGLYLDEECKGRDYYLTSLNENLARSLGSADICVPADFPDSKYVRDTTKKLHRDWKPGDALPVKLVPDVTKVYVKTSDDKILPANIVTVANKADVGANPVRSRVKGVYDNKKCTGVNYMKPGQENSLPDGGPILTQMPKSESVWIKTGAMDPFEATAARFVSVSDPLQVFVQGVFTDEKCQGANYCQFKLAYNDPSLLHGAIQLTKPLPEGTKQLFVQPMPAPEGIGYDVSDGGTLNETAYKVANDMWNIDEYRLSGLEDKGIINEGLSELHGQAKKLLNRADAAKGSLNYSVFDSYCRASWGYEARAYPGIFSTAQDVVNGVIFYLFLILPFAFFIERLFFAFPDLYKQILAFFLIFAFIFLVFYLVHPAFRLLGNSFIILIAFIMLALSILVIFIVTSKFEEQLKQFNRSVSGVHKADIGRMSVAAAAFSLGISNMRRRKARTVLTCITLVLLTFTVLSFTSIVSTLRFNKVPARKDADTHIYDGIMIRGAMWESQQEIAYRLLKDEFGNEGKRGKVYPVAPRAWFFGTTLGEQSFLTVRKGKFSYDARAAVGMLPDEAEIMDLETSNKRAFLAGDWFGYKNGKRVDGPVDPFSMIIPDTMAEKLSITASDVGKVKVMFGGAQYTVIAIVKNDVFKKIKDLDNEPTTPVDFILMSKQGGQQSGGEAGFREYVHHEPANCFIVPYETLMGIGGELKSIAIKYATAEEVQDQLDSLMPRLGLNLYAGVGSSIYRYSSIGSSASKGFSNVFIPVLIAALIVLNTMLGSVFERVREIGIFSAIGLAPNHIAILFIAESMVYANLGAVAGYVIGQTVSKVLSATGWLPGLYLNFSSMSAVSSTLVVVAVVLLSTMYPARKASEVATPAIDRSWKVPEPDGDNWRITLPFAVTGAQAKGVNGFLQEWFGAYEEYSIGDFVTQDVKAGEASNEFGTAHTISCKAWLAPFDLGVSQLVTLSTEPTAMEDVFEVNLLITRESGDISNWKRVNRRFLNTLRKQFLIWRTMRADEREKYLTATTDTAHPSASGEAAPA